MQKKVGITVFAGIIILFALLIIVGTDEYYFSKTYNLVVCIDDAAGLVKGAPVLLGGVKIGGVEKIEFLPDANKENIRVSLKVLSSYRQKITTGTCAEIRGIGILGDKYIHLSIGKNSGEPLPDNANVPYNRGVILEDITKEISPVTQELKSVLVNLHRITDSLATGNGTMATLINTPTAANKLSRVLSDADKLIAALESKDGTTGQLIHNKELYTETKEAVREFRAMITNINSGKGTIGKLVTEDSLYNSIHYTASEVNKLVAKAGNDSTIVGGLLTDKKMLGTIKNLIDELDALVVDIKKNPHKYVKVSVF